MESGQPLQIVIVERPVGQLFTIKQASGGDVLAADRQDLDLLGPSAPAAVPHSGVSCEPEGCAAGDGGPTLVIDGIQGGAALGLRVVTH